MWKINSKYLLFFLKLCYNDGKIGGVIVMNDEYYIDIAIDISKKAKYPYGAIVVKDGEIIGKRDDKTLMETSIYSHAELEAIESASKNKNLYGDLKGATMYVSC